MQCPNCHRENEPASRFCLFCGSLLPAPEAGRSSEPAETPADTILRQLQVLQEEVRHLSDRLATLERRQGMAIPPPPVAVPPPVAAPQPPPQPAVPTKARPTQPREWEQILGGNWLARVGILALIIGVGFFLKFAFDQNWLGPTGRVILGIIGSLAMLGAGHYWHKRYPIFAQTLSGGGIALLYLSLFAAFAIFALIGFYLAAALILLVSAGAAVLALGYNSMALAIIGIIGAFIAPFILAASATRAHGAAQTAQSLWLLVYVMVVDIGVLWLSTFRNWRWFTRLALVGSLAVFGVWYDRFGNTVGLGISMGSLTVLFLIFVGATTLYHIVWRRTPQALDYALMITNAVAYFGISYGLLWQDLEPWLGGFALLLALFYGGLAYVSVRRGVERLAFFALGIALVFLTVAIPVQLGDKAWTTIAWAAQATVLMWLSFKVRLPQLRGFSYAVFAAVTVRLLLLDTTVNLRTFTPVLNERLLAFGVSIVALYLAGYLSWQERNALAAWERSIGYVYPVFLVAANFFSMWVIGAEVISYKFSQLTPREGWPLILLVILAGTMTLYHIVWRRSPQVFDQALLVVNAAFYFGVSASVWGDFRVWMGSLYFLLSFLYGGLAYVSVRRGVENIRLGFFALGIGLLFFTVAIPVELGDKAWTTIAWAAQATVLMWLSFRFQMPQFRIYSCVVFAAVTVRLLFFDTTVDLRTFTPVLNERFLAFLISITAMYLAGYILYRKKRALCAWEQTAWSLYPIFLVAANFFSVWLLSAEVWGHFSKQLAVLAPRDIASVGLRSARNLSLTGLWAVYAAIVLMVGIIKQWRLVRLFALGLLIVPIVKVFIYDVFALEQLYRIIAFVGLGLLLLASAYLYQRYSQTIKGFLIKP